VGDKRLRPKVGDHMIGQRGCHHFYGIKSVCLYSLEKQKQDAASWLGLN